MDQVLAEAERILKLIQQKTDRGIASADLAEQRRLMAECLELADKLHRLGAGMLAAPERVQ